MSRTLTLHLADDLHRRLTRDAAEAPNAVSSPADAKRRTLARLFELFEGNDAEGEVRRLKDEDLGF